VEVAGVLWQRRISGNLIAIPVDRIQDIHR
jgi:hypothetical protein